MKYRPVWALSYMDFSKKLVENIIERDEKLFKLQNEVHYFTTEIN